MKYTITPDRRQLILECTPEERETLREILTDNGKRNVHACFSEQDEREALEELIANSELDWIDPAETGDLTSAPMLGIREFEESEPIQPVPPHHFSRTGKVTERWAFMGYQVKSFLEDLMNHGKATFTS